jgi:hypothetical protein
LKNVRKIALHSIQPHLYWTSNDNTTNKSAIYYLNLKDQEKYSHLVIENLSEIDTFSLGRANLYTVQNQSAIYDIDLFTP